MPAGHTGAVNQYGTSLATNPVPHMRIHGWDAETVVTNIDPGQINLWRDVPYPKIFVYLWEASYQPDAGELVQKLKGAIAGLLKIPEPSVGAPLAASPANRRYSAPWCFLVANIPKPAADELLRRQCISTPSVTFFAIPFAPATSTFICTIENLTYAESEIDQVWKLVVDNISKDERAKACIALENPHPEALRTIIDSIYLKPLKLAMSGGGFKLVWNIYATPPSQTPNNNRAWRRIISSMTFITALNGAGAARKASMTCNGCKSIDHPTGLCPFPKAGEWYANPITNPETPISLEQALAESSQRERGTRGRAGKGQRGRARGRGKRARGN
jgi:hypothetical protein